MKSTFLISKKRAEFLSQQPYFKKLQQQPCDQDGYVQITIALESDADVMSLVYGCMNAGMREGNEMSQNLVDQKLRSL